LRIETKDLLQAGYPRPMARPASALGEYIRRQRELRDLSIRQVAQMAGISNPYLSQIERGLRAPSESVLNAIATSLRTSADALREDAGVPLKANDDSAVVDAIRADERLSASQQRALLEVYKAFTQ
jgi:transcriptional regulator with XRE-family HTH domain